MRDLETLVVDGSLAGYQLFTATGINDAGQIAVDAHQLSSTPISSAPSCSRHCQELISAVSRKTHGAAGVFDVDLPLNGSPGIECRSGAAGHSLIFTFSNMVVSGNAALSGAADMAGQPIFDDRTMTVNLQNAQDRQTLTVSLSGVTDSFGQTMPATTVAMSLLLGDVNNSANVNASDVGQVKAHAGATLNQANFRSDVTANGSINGSDIATVKSASGSAFASRE